MKPKRDRFSTVLYSAVIIMFIIGPFILERSNPNAIIWRMIAMTVLGGLLGFSLLRLKLRPAYAWVAFGLYLVIFWLLAIVQDSFSPTYLNWGSGFLAGAIIGAWPEQREAEAKEKERPAPGWHLDKEEITNSSLLESQALLALRSLDGSTNYFLSVTFGPSRIDIVGNYQHGIAVFCTPDTRVTSKWAILIGTRTEKQSLELQAGPNHTILPTKNIVDAKLAKKALMSFIAHQVPDPTLKWFTGPRVFFLRPPSTR